VFGDTGLNHNSVQRLKGLWERVSEKVREQWSEMDVLMSPQHNFRHYRRELKKRKAPVLPYFGIYLRDFTFINDGNQQYKPDGALITHHAHTHVHTAHTANAHMQRWVWRRLDQRQVRASAVRAGAGGA
jgi:hypothetical protein